MEKDRRIKFKYDREMISKLTGRSKFTIWKDIRDGRLVLGDLISVSRYIVKYCVL